MKIRFPVKMEAACANFWHTDGHGVREDFLKSEVSKISFDETLRGSFENVR